MRFKKIKIKNIRSYLDQEIEFPNGSLLLAGDVGSGKTTILLSIEYALFGLQPGQKGSSLLRHDKKNGEVSLELDVEGKNVVIERKLKRTPRGVSNEYSSLTIGEDKMESSTTEIKTKIVELLGYPLDFVKKNNILYRYTVYTPQEQMKEIILEDPETRLNILRHIFGISKYKQIKENLAVLTNYLKSQGKILQGEIGDIEQEKENLLKRKIELENIRQKINLFEKELEIKIQNRKKCEEELKSVEEKIKEKNSFEREIEKTLILINTKKEMVFSLNKEIEQLNKAISEAIPVEEDFYKDLIAKMEERKNLVEEMSKGYYKAATKLSSLENEKNEVLKKNERIFSIEICPTCLQDVPESHKHNILNESEKKLSEIKNSIGLLNEEVSLYSKKVSENKDELSSLEKNKSKYDILKSKSEQIEKTRTRLIEFEKSKNFATDDLQMLHGHLERLREKNFEYLPFENIFKKKGGELKSAFLEEKEAEISLATLNKESEYINREISHFESVILKKEESKNKLYELNNFVNWLSSQFLNLAEVIERNVLLKIRNEFSSLFRKWFGILVSEGSLDSQLDENFTPITMQNEAEIDYEFLSGGERTAVALAYRLALNQLINSLHSKIKTKGIIILDEPTDGFSETQINRIRDLLLELNVKQLIIVSHEYKIEGFVDNILKVAKESDISRIDSS